MILDIRIIFQELRSVLHDLSIEEIPWYYLGYLELSMTHDDKYLESINTLSRVCECPKMPC
jgi:hypothetical protein